MSKTFSPKSISRWIAFAAILALLSACKGGWEGDTSPADFSFEAVTDAERGSVHTASATMSGINSATPVSITGGLFAIDGGEWIDEGEVTDGQEITVQVTASDQFAVATTATLTVGDKSAEFSVTTDAQDVEPEPFTFESVVNADIDSAYISNAVTVSGINDAVSISIEGGEFEIDGNGEEFIPVTEANATVTVGQTVRVRLTSASTGSQAAQATLTIGNQTGTYSVTTFADMQAPVAKIAFPPPVSMTANTTLTVRGTVTDDYSGVAEVAILINGNDSGVSITPEEGEDDAGIYNWNAQITLTDEADHTITVTTMDAEGNIDNEAASVTVRQTSLNNAFPDLENSIGNVFTAALDLTGERRRLITASLGIFEGQSSITVVDLDTSEVLQSMAIEGLPTGYEYVTAATLDELSNYLYVSTTGADGYGLARLDPQTGVIDSSVSFDREPIDYPGRVIVDYSGEENRVLIVLPGDQIVYQADLALQSYTEFSGPAAPDTENPFEEPSDIVFCECGGNGKFFVIDGAQATVIQVDPITGAREVFSSEGENETTGFDSPNPKRSLALDSVGNKLLITGMDTNQIISVSLEDGRRATVSDDPDMSVWGFTDIVTHPTLGYALAVDGEGLSAVFAVDLESGERVVISKARETELH